MHSNDCFTASGPSKLTGFLTLTDQHGREVPNPAFEFDGCFDPGSDNSPTGVQFPSLLSATAVTVTPDAQGRVAFPVACGTGSDGCAGTVTAVAGGNQLGSVPFDLAEESTAAPRSAATGAERRHRGGVHRCTPRPASGPAAPSRWPCSNAGPEPRILVSAALPRPRGLVGSRGCCDDPLMTPA